MAALWLDGRNMKAGSHESHGAGETHLRYSIFGSDGRASDDALIDPRVCDCCPTSAALTSDGSGCIVIAPKMCYATYR
jgi:hypothetical protein